MIELPTINGPAFVPVHALQSVTTHVFYGSNVYLSVSPGWLVVKLPPADVVQRFEEGRAKRG